MNRKYLMAVFIGLFMLLMSACQKDNPYDSLFHHVEEHHTVFAMTKDEGIAALDLVDYEDKNNTLTLNEELTAEDQKYGQRIRLDNNQLIEGYELVTRLPRSEIGYQQAGRIVEAFLGHYSPSEEEKEKVLDSIHAVDDKTFPVKPEVKLVTESWESNDKGGSMSIHYRLTNSLANAEEISLVLQFLRTASP